MEKKLLVIDCKQSKDAVFDKNENFKVRQAAKNDTLKGRELLAYIKEHFPSKNP